MSTAPGGDDPLAPGVVLVVEQLRRAVPGGIGTYARGLVAGLAQLAAEDGGRRVPLRLYASRPPGGADPVAALGAPLSTSALPGPLLVRAWSAGARLRAGPRALVHATSLALPGGPDRLVATVHDLCWRRFPEAYPPRGRAWHEAALRRAARRARAFVVPSVQVKGELVSAGLGIGAERVAVVEEGADHLPAADEAAARRLLERAGVTGPFLLAVGTREPRKNLARLVAAYGAARPALPEPWPLVLTGPAGWGDPPGGRAAPLEGVVALGWVEAAALAGLYRLARCFCSVPLAEGFGLPVAEAMAAGTPVVSSDVPSAGGASLVVDPLDADAIASALVAAASDEALRSRLVALGAQRSRQLTWRACAADHVALWDQVARG